MRPRSPSARQADLPFTNDYWRDRADCGNAVIVRAIQDIDQIIARMAIAYLSDVDTGEAANILQQAREDIQAVYQETEERLTEYDSATTTGDAPV